MIWGDKMIGSKVWNFRGIFGSVGSSSGYDSYYFGDF